MGKHKKRRERALTPAQQARKEAERQARKRSRRLRIGKRIALIGAGVVVVGAVAFTTVQLLQRNGTFLRGKTAAKTEHFSIDCAALGYFLDECYDSYLEYNKDNLEAINLQLDKKLKNQSYDDTQTWYEMMMDNAMTGVDEMLQMCETAYQHGVSLTDAQKADCLARAEQVDRTGYPKGVQVRDIAKALELKQLATVYRNQYFDAISITDADIEKQYEEHPESYLTWDTLCFSVAWVDTVANAGDLTKEQAKAQADLLLAANDEASFRAAVETFLRDVKLKDEASIESSLRSMKVSTNGSSYMPAVATWAMDDATKIGDTKLLVTEANQTYSVYFLLTEPKRDEGETVDFHVICLPNRDYDSAEDAKAAVEALRTEWTDNGATIEAFETIAKRDSQDSATYQKGGAYVGYNTVQTTYGDAVHDWAFDPTRKTGDVIVTSTDDAAIFAYFDRPNDRCGWQVQAYEDLYEKATTALDDENNLHLITRDEDAIASLDY